MSDEAGDFDAVLAAHAAMIERILRTYELRPAVRADLRQDVALALWQALPRYRGEAAIKTFVATYSPGIVREAALRELKRGGQIYFLHNDIDTIHTRADKLAVPVFRLRARARGLRQFGDEVRIMYDTEAKAALAMLENELGKAEWIAAKRPTIADIGAYGVLRYSAEANIDLTPYPNVSAWKKRFEALPGFGTPEQILPMESRLL